MPSRVPTANEIENILRPWRSDNLRKIAWRIWGCGNNQLILLRTHYNPEDNYNIEGLVDSDELDKDDKAWWALLDDPDLFNFGDQWWLIFDILPELAGPLQDYTRKPYPELVTGDRQHFKDELPKLKETDAWRADRNKCLELETSDIRRTVSKGYFAIADEEAFKTDRLRLIYLDGKRNIVQEGRVDFNEQTFADVAVEWDQLALSVDLWDEGMVGEKYRIDGELGRELYQLSEADLE